jgi:hypothetical protein
MGANQPTSFLVSVDGGEYIEVPVTIKDNAIKIHYNISWILNGTHTVTIKAVNL